MLILLSAAPLATHVPSGWNLTEFTPASWSWKVLMQDFEVTSQSFTVLSSDADAISLESGANSASRIQLL